MQFESYSIFFLSHQGESEDASTSCDPNPTNPYTILDQLVSATSSVAIQETAENKGALKSGFLEDCKSNE